MGPIRSLGPIGPICPIPFQFSGVLLFSLPFLIPPPEPKRREIGFHTKPGEDSVAQGEENAGTSGRGSLNATLEAMARALFQSWFVDFDPVRAKATGRKPAGMDAATAALFPNSFQDSELGKIPKGWEHVNIANLCTINASTLRNKDDFETLEYVEISEVNKGNINNIERGKEPSHARRRLKHGDIVISMVRPDRGSYFLSISPPKNRVVSTGFAVFTPTKAPWSLIHAAISRAEFFEHLGKIADGGAYPAVRPDSIGACKVTLPDKTQILDKYHLICAQIFERSEANRIQSRTLATLRDTLLPKLLSGELNIRN